MWVRSIRKPQPINTYTYDHKGPGPNSSIKHVSTTQAVCSMPHRRMLSHLPLGSCQVERELKHKKKSVRIKCNKKNLKLKINHHINYINVFILSHHHHRSHHRCRAALRRRRLGTLRTPPLALRGPTGPSDDLRAQGSKKREKSRKNPNLVPRNRVFSG